MLQSVTIITSVRNCLDETKVFIESLFSHKPTNLDQVIIVDDGSEEETKDFLRSLRGNIRLTRNDKSIGFGPANNLGVEQSQSDWLLFMNNDLVLTRDWAKPFETVMNGEQNLTQLGCLGNVQMDPRTKLIDHAGITFSKGYPSHFLQGEENPPNEGFSEYLAVTGACFLIRKDLFSRAGGFDSEYKTGFEDIDLCLKLRMLGYRHYTANQSKIWHKRSSTPERNDYQAHNSKVFYGRWGKVMTRLEEWERAHTTPSQQKKKQYSYILEKPESFLFADRDLLIQNFQFHLRNRMWKESEKVLKLLKENFGGDADLILLESQLLRKSDQPSKAKTLLTKGGDESSTSSFLLEEALVTKALGEMTSARRKFLSLAKKGFIPGVCFHHIGECYLDEKKFEDAKKYYKKALVHLPDSFRIWNRLAKVHQELGDKSDEINVLQKTLSLSPQNSSTFLTLFQSLVGIGSWTKAYQLCIRSKGIQLPPKHLLDFSKACIESGDIKFAIISLNKLISKRHDVAEAYFLKGNIMVLLKEFSKAVECYMKALDYREDWPEALSNLYNSKTFLCDWSERKKELENLQAFHETGSILGGAFELAGLYWSEEEESKYTQMRSGKIVADAEAIRRRLNFVYKLQKRTKKRIGFLSSDFRNHAVGHQIVALFENLDSEKYELFIYATSPSEDSAVRKRIENISKNFKNLSSFSLVNKAIAIHRDELDLLVDLGGFSRGHNAQLLALRPAVKQAHYLGYASSMGAEFVDYMIADVTVIPPSSSKFYGEKVVRMSGCFFPPGDFQGFAKRAKRKEVGLPSRGIVYCAFHAAYKIEPEIWGCWMRILKAVPESVLWLKFKPADEAIKNLKADAVRLGVSSKRIILAEDLPDREAHLSRMAVADLYLDCPLYNGHASAMDALRAKLPILTVKGNRFCNRVGESFCKNLDLQEMICKDLRKYEEKAIELGLRPSKLLPLRKKIQENADAVLSPIEHTKRFEEALDIILAKPKKVAQQSAYSRPKKSVVSTKAHTSSLGDFSLVMIRPQGISNWAYNVSMLADELNKFGASTIVLDQTNQKAKKLEFSKSVHVINLGTTSFTEAVNHALSELKSKYLFYLDDPLRVLPASHLIETVKSAKEALGKAKTGVLGICSSMEPHTGCLVTRVSSSNKQNPQVAGFFCPSFIVNLDAVLLTGGLRKFGDSMALSVLDLSLRLEKEGYSSSLIETDKIICPAHSGKEYLSQSSKSHLHRFVKLWNRKPSSLKPKYPSKDEQVGETADYQEWIRLCDSITEGDILAFKKEVGDLNKKPLISLVMPVFDPPKKFLIKAIESVFSQVYKNWELCIADDASTKKYIRPLLESYASKDSRVKVTFRKTNGHISVASNSAIKLATGQFVAFMDHDDELRPHSLLEVAKVINQHPDAKLIYSDEDKIEEHGVRYDPYFKPDWNPDLLLGQNYISHFSVFEVSLLRRLKGLRKGYEGSQDWDLTLRITEQIKDHCILHVPKILYHWRAAKGSTALSNEEKNYAIKAGVKAVRDCFRRRQIKGEVESLLETWCRVKRSLPECLPKVSILIPTRDRIDLLDKCITSIFGTIEYKNIEIIVIDNESRKKRSNAYLDEIKKENRVKVLSIKGEFNYSKLNNLAVGKAQGQILLLLNNDIEAINQGWFEEMLSHAMRCEIGCVGAKLLYPDDRLQHGGVIVGLSGGAGHSHKFAGKGSRGYSGHLSVVRNVSAVTAACMMIRKEIYQNAGGLDEKSFKVAFNDVDFCLRVEKLGYRNLWTPFAELVHHESASRGDDHSTTEKRSRFSREIVSLKNKWSLKSYYDSHYNPNLTKLSEQYWFGISKNASSKTSQKDLVRSENNFKPDQNLPKKLARNQYKETWDDLSNSFDSAKLHVTGDANENELRDSSLITISRINRHVQFKRKDVVLEIGCGIGRVGKELALRCKKWIGCDISGNMLAHARKRLSHLENIELIELPECTLAPIQDGCVDVVYCTVVFMHLDEWDRYEYVKEAFRVLKPGGRAYFDNFSLATEEGWNIFEAHYEMKARPSHISKSSTSEELYTYLMRAKFSKIKTQIDGAWAIVSGLKK